MSPTARKLVTKVHLWLGLPAAAVLVVVALTGALLVYEKELDRAWHPELWRLATTAPALPLDTLLSRAQAVAPGYALKEVRLTAGSGQPVEFRFDRGPHVRLDPATGATLGTRARGASFFGMVERLHTSLVLGEVGKWIVVTSTVILLALLGTGLVLWWPKQWRLLKGAVTLALGRKGRAFHFNLHNTLGFWSAIPLFAMALTGAIIGIKPLGDAVRRIGGGSDRATPPPVAASDAALPPASLDTLVAAATQTFPDWQELRLHPPRTKGGQRAEVTGDSEIPNLKSKVPAAPGEPWLIEAVTAGTPHDQARSAAYLDPRSAALLGQVNFADRPIGERLRALVLPVHDGSILGRPTQLIALLAVLVLPLLSATGVALWWLRTRARRARETCAAAGLIRPAPLSLARQPRPAAPANCMPPPPDAAGRHLRVTIE